MDVKGFCVGDTDEFENTEWYYEDCGIDEDEVNVLAHTVKSK